MDWKEKLTSKPARYGYALTGIIGGTLARQYVGPEWGDVMSCIRHLSLTYLNSIVAADLLQRKYTIFPSTVAGVLIGNSISDGYEVIQENITGTVLSLAAGTFDPMDLMVNTWGSVIAALEKNQEAINLISSKSK